MTVAAFTEQMQALQPVPIHTLKQLGNQQMLTSLTEHLSPLAILGGESVADVAIQLLDRLPLSATNENGVATQVAEIVTAARPAPKKEKKGKTRGSA